MIAPRQKAGPTTGVALSLVFAFLLVIVATADLFVFGKLAPQQPLPTSIRLPTVGLYTDTQTAGTSYRYLRVEFPRGSQLSDADRRLVESYEDRRRPPGPALLAGLGAGFFLIFEGHVQVGDVVRVGEVVGQVESLSPISAAWPGPASSGRSSCSSSGCSFWRWAPRPTWR